MERRWVSMLLGLTAGVLICASLPPWGWWPLAPVGIALWLHVLGGAGRRRRIAVSWAVGVGWFAPSVLWMLSLAAPGYFFGVLLYWPALVAAVGLICPPDRRRLLVMPAALVAMEWFAFHAPFGGVPLSMLAMGQAHGPLLAITRVGGPLLVGMAVGALGSALHVAVVQRRWVEPVGVVGLCALVAAVGVASLHLVHDADVADGEPSTPRIALVQGGGPQGTRYSASDGPVVFERHLAATRRIDQPVDLVIWPENAINVDGSFDGHPWQVALSAEAERLDAPIVVGVVDEVPDDETRFYNYVVVVEPDGSLGDRYDKVRRVPFGEYVPLRPIFEPVAGDVLPQRDQVPGTEAAVIDTTAGPLAVAISWEVFFPRRVREGVREGGEIVANPTNGSSYWLTQVQAQQTASSALRAVESGRWVLQVAPTGFSAVVDDTGRVRQRSDIGEATVLYAEVPRLSGTTPAQATGDLIPVLAALGIAAGLFTTERRRARRSAQHGAPDAI